MARLHNLIKPHFKLGLLHGEILNVLSYVDDINVGMHTLRRVLKCMRDTCQFRQEKYERGLGPQEGKKI